ncbi:translation initiation factor IF-2 [Candidatus Micrarchaeota archaeon]|nr:translation initiation factor IF-2 [Candidatus Micrarchaeota archaeon]
MSLVEIVLLMKFKRSPIICLLAHVDHGKTTLLDSIRGTGVAKKEAGGITQMIGASYVSKKTIDEVSKNLAETMKLKIEIPGLLFIDTPGHEAFTNLRDRGGSLADLVILLVDINQGFQPQTVESIKILKQHKTPFIIAANKVDMLNGWKSHPTKSFFESFAQQPEHIRQRVDEKMYGIMGSISEHGFDSERFDRVSDFSKQVAIVPISAKTKEGLAELLVLIGGLSQKFLGSRLEIESSGRGKGSIIEVKDERGMGTTVDVILYDGILRKNDEIAYMTANGIRKTKVRSLLEPNLSGKEKFRYVDEVIAAAGVKISAQDLEGAIPGSPVEVIHDFEKDRVDIENRFKEVIFQKNEEGVIIRAESLGSVEAILSLLKDAEINVRDAAVGQITKKDILAAAAQDNRYLQAVLGFNVNILDEAREESKKSGAQIIYSNIIYKLLEDYQEWIKSEKEAMKKDALSRLTLPGKIIVLDGYVFRASKPAIFGVEVIAGKIRKNYRLMNNGGIVGEIREIQKDKEKVDEAKTKDQLAISCDGINIGKNVMEGDVLYTYMTKDEIDAWNERLNMLSDEEKGIFEEQKRMLLKVF